MERRTQKILVYSSLTSGSRIEIEKLLPVNPNLRTTIVYSLAECHSLLQVQRYDIALFVALEELDPQLIRLIKRTKNLSFHRNVQLVAYFREPSKSGLQQALMCGVAQVYLEPIPSRTVRDDLIYLLGHDEVRDTIGRLRIVDKSPILVQSFGRIGYVQVGSHLKLHAEGDLDLQTGQRIQCRLALNPNLESATETFQVEGTGDHNLFYSYEQFYDLTLNREWPSPVSLAGEVVGAKAKVLWFTNDSSGLDAQIDRTKLSLYTSDEHDHASDWYRIDPQVIVIEDITPGQLRKLQDWLRDHPRLDRICLATAADMPAGWLSAAGKKRREILAQIEHKLAGTDPAIPNAQYIARRSKLSRLTFESEGHLVAISHAGLKLHLNVRIAPGAIIRVVRSGNSPFAVYVRIVACEALTGEGFHIYAAFVPKTQNPKAVAPKVLDIYHENVSADLRLTAIHPPEAAARRRHHQVGKALFYIMLMAIIGYSAAAWIPARDIRSQKTAPWQEIRDSIRNAFR